MDPQPLPLEMLSPSVDFVSRWDFSYDTSYTYRIPSHHMLLVESGCVSSVTPYGAFEAHRGSLICYRPASINQYSVIKQTVLFQAHIMFAQPPHHLLTPFCPGQGFIPIHIVLGGSFEKMRDCFDTLCRHITRPETACRLKIKTTALAMLGLLADVMQPSKNDPPERLDELERLRLLLGSAGCFATPINELASRNGMSSQTLNRLFRQRFGVSPKSYQLSVRLREALRRIGETEHPIKAIAADLGFSDERCLAKHLRSRFGVSPTDLRKGPTPSISLPADPRSGGYPLNCHLVPPETPPDWLKNFAPVAPSPQSD